MKKQFLGVLTPLILGLSPGVSAGDLIAFWNFDNVSDGMSIDAQAGNVGVLLNGAQFTSAGTGRTGTGTDRAMLFGNDRHRMHVTDASFLNAAGEANALSISFWQNLAELRNQTTFFANSATVQRAFSAHTPWSNGTIYWDTAGCCDEGTQRVFVDPGATWLSTWNHIVLVKSGDAKIIYVNGVEVLNGVNTGPLPTDFTELFIGNSSNQAEAVSGSLDDVAFFKRELTPAEVASLAGGASPASIDPPNDTDSDGLPDAWELRFAADLNVLTATGDADSDGLANAAEFSGATKPTSNDTDADGFLDGVETKTGTWVSATNTGTSPVIADTDGDGLKDGAENNSGVFVSVTAAGTNPLVMDTDGDGFGDGAEALYSSANPTNEASRPLRPGLLDLLAYWDFNNDGNPTETLDKVRNFPGTLKDGTLYSADAGGRTGQPGDKAVDMGAAGNSGTGVIVEGGGFLNIAGAQNQVAISFWQNLSGTPDSSSMYAQSATVERGINVHSPWSNGNIYFDTSGCCDGGTQRIDVAGGLTPGVWEHVVLNKNGNTKAIWVNGVKIKEGTNTSPLATNFTRFFMGTDGGALNMAGLIDDVAVYADALTDAQIAQLFAGTKPNDPALVPPNTDSDGDGMQDAYELANGLNPNVDDRAGDLDTDGLTNLTEFNLGTLPNNADSDSDTLKDGVETKTGTWVSATNTGTDPLKADTDGDALADAVETNTGAFVSLTNTGTDPNKGDTDGDKWPDLTEIQWPSNPALKSSVPALDSAKLDLLAYWDFNDNSSPRTARDLQHGFEANFFGDATAFSDGGLGASGAATDRALDLGVAGGNNGAHVSGAKWFGLGVPKGKVMSNLGSLGEDGDMRPGAGVFGVPGALTGSTDTAINLPSVLNTAVPYNSALNPSGAWTAEAWVNPAAANPAGTLTCVLSSGDFAAPRKGWLIYQSDTGWNLRTYYSDGLATAVNITGDNGAAPTPGAWTHLVASWDGTVARLYVDGVLRVTSDPKPYVAGVAGGFAVGSRADAGFAWNGDADEVAFYNTALSDAVILDHYNNAKAAAPAQPYNALVLASNPVGYWRMTDSTPGDVPPDQVAVSFWQKLDATSDSSAFWASSPSSSSNERGFQAHAPWSNGNIYFDTAGCCASPAQRLEGPGEAVVGEWQHFVFQKNGGSKQVWRDGTMILSGEDAATLPNDFTRLTIGAEPAGSGGVNATRGLIDEFAVFGEALTEAQIQRLAAGESAKSLVGGGGTPIEFTSVSYDPATNQLTLTWKSQPGSTYTLQASQTLRTWPLELNDNIASGGATTTFTHTVTNLPGAAPALFYRVKQNP